MFIPHYTHIYSIFYNVGQKIVLKKETIQGMNFVILSRVLTFEKPKRTLETLRGVLQYEMINNLHSVIYLGEQPIYLPAPAPVEEKVEGDLSLIPYTYPHLENTPAPE
jgi:hypothetical protein